MSQRILAANTLRYSVTRRWANGEERYVEQEAEEIYGTPGAALVIPRGQYHETVVDCRVGEQCYRIYGPDGKLAAVLRLKDGIGRLSLAFGGPAESIPPLAWLPQNWLLLAARDGRSWVYVGRGDDGPATQMEVAAWSYRVGAE